MASPWVVASKVRQRYDNSSCQHNFFHQGSMKVLLRKSSNTRSSLSMHESFSFRACSYYKTTSYDLGPGREPEKSGRRSVSNPTLNCTSYYQNISSYCAHLTVGAWRPHRTWRTRHSPDPWFTILAVFAGRAKFSRLTFNPSGPGLVLLVFDLV